MDVLWKWFFFLTRYFSVEEKPTSLIPLLDLDFASQPKHKPLAVCIIPQWSVKHGAASTLLTLSQHEHNLLQASSGVYGMSIVTVDVASYEHYL